jgi:2-dehydro-3-deoxygluconokinase
VAIGLARLGHHTGWISKLGEAEFGKAILASLKVKIIFTSWIISRRCDENG